MKFVPHACMHGIHPRNPPGQHPILSDSVNDCILSTMKRAQHVVASDSKH